MTSATSNVKRRYAMRRGANRKCKAGMTGEKEEGKGEGGEESEVAGREKRKKGGSEGGGETGERGDGGQGAVAGLRGRV